MRLTHPRATLAEATGPADAVGMAGRVTTRGLAMTLEGDTRVPLQTIQASFYAPSFPHPNFRSEIAVSNRSA